MTFKKYKRSDRPYVQSLFPQIQKEYEDACFTRNESKVQDIHYELGFRNSKKAFRLRTRIEDRFNLF